MKKIKAHTVFGIFSMIFMLLAIISGFAITHKPKKNIEASGEND